MSSRKDPPHRVKTARKDAPQASGSNSARDDDARVVAALDDLADLPPDSQNFSEKISDGSEPRCGALSLEEVVGARVDSKAVYAQAAAALARREGEMNLTPAQAMTWLRGKPIRKARHAILSALTSADEKIRTDVAKWVWSQAYPTEGEGVKPTHVVLAVIKERVVASLPPSRARKFIEVKAEEVGPALVEKPEGGKMLVMDAHPGQEEIF